jgi:membrane-associated phospholipid phosphatase
LKPDSTIGKISQFLQAHEGSLLIVFFGILIPLCWFDWLAEAIRHQENLPWDTAVLRFLQGSLPLGGDKLLSLIARTGEINVVVVLAVVGVLVLKRARRMRDAFFLTFALVGVVIGNLLVRTLVQRTQSTVWGTFAPTFESGFPSSQAADTFTIALVFAVLTWPTRWRWLTVLLGVFYVFAVGLSRVHLGLHYPSDVLAGWTLALAWVTTASFVRRTPIKPKKSAIETETGEDRRGGSGPK